MKNNHNIQGDNADKIRLSSPKKSIWLYTGYTIEELGIFNPMLKFLQGNSNLESSVNEASRNCIRQQIISMCDVLIDGKYIDSQRDITLPWCGSSNQRIIDIQQSLKKGEAVLWK